MFNKSGQLASGLGWFVATIIIFFILVVFLTFSGIIAIDPTHDPNLIEVVSEETGRMNYESFRGLVSFLEGSSINSDGETVLMRDLIIYETLNKYGRDEKKELIEESLVFGDCFSYYLILPGNLRFSNHLKFEQSVRILHSLDEIENVFKSRPSTYSTEFTSDLNSVVVEEGIKKNEAILYGGFVC